MKRYYKIKISRTLLISVVAGVLLAGNAMDNLPTGVPDELQEEIVWNTASYLKPEIIRGKSIESEEKETRLKLLTQLQYDVTQNNATERPFQNEFWDNELAGIYVDIVSGEPLFVSLDKYKSGTGWPSFKKPLVVENIIEVMDRTWFTVRTEVRSLEADSHLGHLFEDGPVPTGLRYCINSAALRFIPVSRLADEGYGEFIQLFK